MTRRDRHAPRVCRSCQAPLNGNDDGCWSCGAAWVQASAPTLMPPPAASTDPAAQATAGRAQEPAPLPRPIAAPIAGVRKALSVLTS